MMSPMMMTVMMTMMGHGYDEDPYLFDDRDDADDGRRL